jgi:CheY-like chemotaxis protein
MTARILIIEDNKTNLELAEYLLKAFGYTTFSAADGLEGLRVAREMHPDLIICDLQMPVMDGYEAMRELRKDPLLRKMIIVAVTALSMPGDRDTVLSEGFDGYVPKPIDPETFVPTIEKFMPAALHARRLRDS